METGTTVFHFSVQQDASRPLNYSHEYQVVFIEPNDGSHIFELQLGAHARILMLRIGSLCSVADMSIVILQGRLSRTQLGRSLLQTPTRSRCLTTH